MSDTVLVTIEDGVAVVRIDDGKMNALSHEVLEQLHGALDTAEAQAQAVCFVGNGRALSAGFDLSVMTAGPESARGLVTAGAEFLVRVYGHRQPTVAAVTGHALAAGALLALACDTRVAADRASKIGLNEVAIGLALPVFAIELARDRLSKRAFTRAAIQAEIFDPAGALSVGFVDRVVGEAECETVAIAEARRLSALSPAAYGITKQSVRGKTIEYVLATLADDMNRLVPPTG
jgi:enoyl-CoA hydratase